MKYSLIAGIGYGMIIISSIVATYYNIIIAWTIFYVFASMTKELPWERCHNSWSTHGEYCKTYKYINLIVTVPKTSISAKL